jgi:NAD(P)-dependent dehydrogenase (short-subunit alcohol dehydrogenase family)
VQIARTASDADTLATTIRYAVHLDRRSCGERQDFVTIMMHTLQVPWADPIDLSNAVLFDAPDESRYIAGVSLPVDAGSLLK